MLPMPETILWFNNKDFIEEFEFFILLYKYWLLKFLSKGSNPRFLKYLCLLIFLVWIISNKPNLLGSLKTILNLSFSFNGVAEILVGSYGIIYRNYKYGEILGYKVLGVPLIIGINWCILTLIKGAIFTLFLIIIGVKYFVEHY